MAGAERAGCGFPEDEGERKRLEVTVGEDGMVRIRESGAPGVVAVTTPAKWEAFVKGVKAGEFDHFAALAEPTEP